MQPVTRPPLKTTNGRFTIKDTKNDGFSHKGGEAAKEAMRVDILAKVATVLETPW
jgi:hypothetical protein